MHSQESPHNCASFCTVQNLLPFSEKNGRGSPRPDDTRVDELHDLSPYGRVLHVVLQRSRVALRLLQDALHHRVGHNLLKIQKQQLVSIQYSSPSPLLTRTATSGSRIARSIVSCSVSFAR